MNKSEIMNVFKNRLKDLRNEKGLSQDKLAEDLGISKGAISYYETGQRAPDIVVLSAIADYFNVSADYLLGRCGSKSNDKDLSAVSDYLGVSDEATDTICKCAGKFHNNEDYYAAVFAYIPMNNKNITDWCIRNLLFAIYYTVVNLLADLEKNAKDINNNNTDIGEKAYININRLADFIKNRIDKLMINCDKESGNNNYRTIYDVQKYNGLYFLFNDNGEQNESR